MQRLELESREQFLTIFATAMGELQQLISFSPQAVFSIKMKWHYVETAQRRQLGGQGDSTELGSYTEGR